MPAPTIALVSGNAPPVVCGIGDYTTRLASELRALDYPVHHYTRAQTGVRETDTVHAPVPRMDTAGIDTLATRLRADSAGVLHLQYEADTFDNNGFALLRFALAARKHRLPLVTTFHALDGPRPWRGAHRLALIAGIWASENIVVCSRRQHTALCKLPGVAAKTHLIPVGSAVPVTGNREKRGANEPLRLLYFGFVWRGRGIETCVRALASVRAHTPAILIIAGGIKDEAYRNEVAALAASLGVAEHVSFTGDLPAPALSDVLANADIALLPFASGVSTGRTTFVAAIEHGLPTVTMASPDNLVPFFENGVNLVYVSPDDADGFVRETVRLATDPPLRARIAVHAPALAAHFSWQEIARKTANLYEVRD